MKPKNGSYREIELEKARQKARHGATVISMRKKWPRTWEPRTRTWEPKGPERGIQGPEHGSQKAPNVGSKKPHQAELKIRGSRPGAEKSLHNLTSHCSSRSVVALWRISAIKPHEGCVTRSRDVVCWLMSVILIKGLGSPRRPFLIIAYIHLFTKNLIELQQRSS
jgi:hypothetical protein